MAAELEIADGFALPLDVAGEATSILAVRGAGKSFTAAVIIEELFKNDIQVVVADPTGVFWGLRGGSNDKEGLPIYVFGGQHGDLPLEATAGDLLADLAVEEGHSFVLDLSSFETKGAQTRFMRAFAERLYRRKASSRSTLHFVLDEADDFAPQKPLGRDEPFLLGAMEAIVRRGRSRGIGVTMITQRSAALNKNVLALSENLIIMRTTSPQDRKAIEGWISHHYLSDELNVLDSLPGLRTGSAWVWSPVRDILKQVDIRHIRTFDSYRSPKPGEAPRGPRKMAMIDLDELGKRMDATVERAKAADPRELRKRIEELEKTLRQRPIETKIERVPVEVPVLGDSDIGDLEVAVQEMRDAANTIIEPIIVKCDEMLLALNERKLTDVRLKREAVSMPREQPIPVETPEAPHDVSSNGFIPTGPQQKILNAIAELESLGLEPDRSRIGWIAGYSQSGHFGNLISKLHTAGAVFYPRDGAVALSDLGRKLAEAPAAPMTTAELHERVMSLLSDPHQRVLRVILAAYPDDISREDVGKQTGYSQSGHFGNLLSKLTTFGTIERVGSGRVRATEKMFVG